jgi:predicted XRE-type DNA-binding protein
MFCKGTAARIGPSSRSAKTKSAYEELEFPDAGEMLVKAQLVVKIAEILREREWSQQEAAKVLGLTQPKLSKMLRGQFRGISEMKLMDCLVRLGRGQDRGRAGKQEANRAVGSGSGLGVALSQVSEARPVAPGIHTNVHSARAQSSEISSRKSGFRYFRNPFTWLSPSRKDERICSCKLQREVGSVC